MPAAIAWAAAARMRRARTSVDTRGATASTSVIALSTSTPVGSPPASRTILPPAGSGVALVMPGQAQHRRADPHRVAVDAAERHRPLAERGVEAGPGRERAAPRVLIPAAALDPLAGARPAFAAATTAATAAASDATPRRLTCSLATPSP
jgi:hypothetical protein